MHVTYREQSPGLGLTLYGHEVFSNSMALLCQKLREKGVQNEMCFISELVRVGKEEMGQNPCASCGASPYFHFLPDFSFVAPPDLSFLVSLFHSLYICSIRTTVFCFPPLHFHRQLKWLWICTHTVPRESVSLLKFRSLSSQRQDYPPTASWLPPNPFPKFCTRTQPRKWCY